MVSKLPGIRAPNPLSYTGPKFNLMPVFGFTREPTINDNKYLISSFVVILDNPSTGAVGDLWYLSRIDSGGDAIWLKLESGKVTDGIDTVTTDDGLPVVDPDGNGNINILGGVGISVTGIGPGNTITVTATGVISETITGDSGGPLSPAAGNWNIFGAAVLAGTSPIVTSGTGSTLTVNAQISQSLAAADVTKIGLANFDSAFFTVDADGFVTTSGSGLGETITGDAGGPLSPTAGNWNILGRAVFAGTTPVSTLGSISTLNVDVQLSQALAATDVTKVGLSNFDSAHFAVDVDGFVSIIAPGTDETITGDTGGPLSPFLGNWNIFAATVVAGTVPITTSGTTTIPGETTLTIQAQTSQAIAAADVTKVGFSNFDSAHFAVDVDGFVTLTSAGSLVWIDEGSGITLSVDTGYYITAAVTETMPASPVQGDTVKIICDNAGPIVITANAGQTISLGASSTSVAGTATSTALGDSLDLYFRASTSQWKSLSTIGNWSLV